VTGATCRRLSVAPRDFDRTLSDAEGVAVQRSGFCGTVTFALEASWARLRRSVGGSSLEWASRVPCSSERSGRPAAEVAIRRAGLSSMQIWTALAWVKAPRPTPWAGLRAVAPPAALLRAARPAVVRVPPAGTRARTARPPTRARTLVARTRVPKEGSSAWAPGRWCAGARAPISSPTPSTAERARRHAPAAKSATLASARRLARATFKAAAARAPI
jgi:hypothetical protein